MHIHATPSARRLATRTIAEPAMTTRMAAAAAVVASLGGGAVIAAVTPSGKTVRKAGSLPVPCPAPARLAISRGGNAGKAGSPAVQLQPKTSPSSTGLLLAPSGCHVQTAGSPR